MRPVLADQEGGTMLQCQNILPRADMNGDYLYTISDLWMQIKTVFHMPAKLLVEAIATSPGVAQFLELTCWSGESVFGGVFSLIAWSVVLTVVSTALVITGNSLEK
jgi:hypothetical protein